MRTYLEPISDPLVFISVGVAYLKWWPQVRWKGLDAKRVDVFLGLKYSNLNQSRLQRPDGQTMGLKKSLIFKKRSA